MANRVEFKLQGLDQVLKKMKGLAPDLRAKGARTAMRKAANVVRDATVANAQRLDDSQTPESIAKNVAVSFSTKAFKATGDIMMRVGIRGGARAYADTRENRRSQRAGKSYATGGSKGNPGGDTWYWRLLETGTSRTRARPFLRPALVNNIDAATDAAVGELGKAIDRYAKKGAP